MIKEILLTIIPYISFSLKKERNCQRLGEITVIYIAIADVFRYSTFSKQRTLFTFHCISNLQQVQKSHVWSKKREGLLLKKQEKKMWWKQRQLSFFGQFSLILQIKSYPKKVGFFYFKYLISLLFVPDLKCKDCTTSDKIWWGWFLLLGYTILVTTFIITFGVSNNFKTK